jgi:hypothetical protein
MSGVQPILNWTETDAAANNRVWVFDAQSEQFNGRLVNDALGSAIKWLEVDRTANTVDTVKFPTATAGSFFVGTSASILPNTVSHILAPASNSALVSKAVSTASASALFWNSDTTGNNAILDFGTEAAYTTRGSITYNRGGGLIAYNTTSDRRLKINIQDATIDSGDVIDSIRVREFDWIEPGHDHIEYGFVAQELYESAPQAVTVGDNGEDITKTWQVDSSKLVPLLVKEIQDLRQRVQELETRH